MPSFGSVTSDQLAPACVAEPGVLDGCEPVVAVVVVVVVVVGCFFAAPWAVVVLVLAAAGVFLAPEACAIAAIRTAAATTVPTAQGQRRRRRRGSTDDAGRFEGPPALMRQVNRADTARELPRVSAAPRERRREPRAPHGSRRARREPCRSTGHPTDHECTSARIPVRTSWLLVVAVTSMLHVRSWRLNYRALRCRPLGGSTWRGNSTIPTTGPRSRPLSPSVKMSP
jgi:hypothetical protein